MDHDCNEIDILKKLPTVSRQYIQLIDRYLMSYELNSSLYYYILKLYDFGDLPQEKLVQLTGVNASNVTRALQKLMDSNYVIRKENPSDRRGYLLSLTPKGREMYHIILNNLKLVNEMFLQPLTPEEQNVFITAIHKLNS
ncbi:transcriptional regulator [Enterococcus saigonensis]|uniref:Transcriptional regulator n=1 Tax=Enterococcus saigonensis TaxID=1805431 RepID=A0A679I9Z7_9ENTE|nr:MarR family transcriptional regulator [Enterococcus saigonensis]BCA86478.1 transcriptional regulator [Enterococcus saigonensis]